MTEDERRAATPALVAFLILAAVVLAALVLEGCQSYEMPVYPWENPLPAHD